MTQKQFAWKIRQGNTFVDLGNVVARDEREALSKVVSGRKWPGRGWKVQVGGTMASFDEEDVELMRGYSGPDRDKLKDTVGIKELVASDALAKRLAAEAERKRLLADEEKLRREKYEKARELGVMPAGTCPVCQGKGEVVRQIPGANVLMKCPRCTGVPRRIYDNECKLKMRKCRKCGGTGNEPPYMDGNCSACGGSGADPNQVELEHAEENKLGAPAGAPVFHDVQTGRITAGEVDCPMCRGSGKGLTSDDLCPQCNGYSQRCKECNGNGGSCHLCGGLGRRPPRYGGWSAKQQGEFQSPRDVDRERERKQVAKANVERAIRDIRGMLQKGIPPDQVHHGIGGYAHVRVRRDVAQGMWTWEVSCEGYGATHTTTDIEIGMRRTK